MPIHGQGMGQPANGSVFATTSCARPAAPRFSRIRTLAAPRATASGSVRAARSLAVQPGESARSRTAPDGVGC
jgi:hypothetical protein